MSIKFPSINAKGLNDPAKRSSFWKEALQLGCDVLCIQEMHYHLDLPPKCSHRNFPHTFYASLSAKKRGVLLAIRDSVAFTLIEEIKDTAERYVILVCDLNSTRYTVVNVYAPNTHQIPFLNKRMHKVNKFRQGSLILCGSPSIYAVFSTLTRPV